jgi:hypothetical protein
MEPDLSAGIDALSSCITRLRASAAPADEDRISALEDRLAKLKLAAIVSDLNSEQVDYEAALSGIRKAIQQANDALAGIAEVSKAIDTAAQAAGLVDKALSVVAL